MRRVVVVAALILVLGACSGGGAAPERALPPVVEALPPGDVPADLPSAIETDCPSRICLVQSQADRPAVVAIRGHDVVWTNLDRVPHRITFGDHPSRLIEPGQQYVRSFADPGRFEYRVDPSGTPALVVVGMSGFMMENPAVGSGRSLG